MFLLLAENPIVRGDPTSLICDIANSFGASLGPVFSKHGSDVEAYTQSEP